MGLQWDWGSGKLVTHISGGQVGTDMFWPARRKAVCVGSLMGCGMSSLEEAWWQQQKTASATHNLPDSSLSHCVTNHLLSHAFSFYFFASPSLPSCCLPVSLLLSQTPSWQIAFALLHFRIITRRCHPEKLTITTTQRFNSPISSMTDNINGKNGQNNNTKHTAKKKKHLCPCETFSKYPTIYPTKDYCLLPEIRIVKKIALVMHDRWTGGGSSSSDERLRLYLWCWLKVSQRLEREELFLDSSDMLVLVAKVCNTMKSSVHHGAEC